MMQKIRNDVVLLVFAIICVLGLLLFNWSKQNVSVIPETINTENNQTAQPNPTDINDKYFSTIIPGEFVISSHNDEAKGITFSRYVFNQSNQQISNQLAITIGKLPSEGIRGLSDVNFRLKNPIYSTATINNANELAEVFKTNNPFELSVFWPNQNYYASIVISGTQDKSEKLQKTLEDILLSWKWKN